jgi:DhnA family fructose-bisphosphate aldolase class Ia
VSGTALRLGRLFDRESGRSFIAAIDHGVTLGVPTGAERAIEAIQRAIACQPDAVLIGPGLLDKAGHLFASRQAPAPIVRGDFIIAAQSEVGYLGEAHRVLISPAHALSLGADAYVNFLIVGVAERDLFADNVEAVARNAEEAHKVGLPYIVEAVAWGSQAAERRKDPALLAFAARMAVELGADAIKTEYTGDLTSMRQVIESVPAPVLVLGGPKTNAPGALVDATRDAMAAGAKGVIYGRNVWQADDPFGISRQLREAIHGAATGRN